MSKSTNKYIHSESNRKHYFNENYFSVIDTADKAYFLGLLHSDGNVSKDPRNSIEISLSEEDVDILYKFKNFLQADQKVTITARKEGSCFPNAQRRARFALYSKKMKEDLVKLKCIPQKTHNLDFYPDLVPEQFMKDYLRGYIDGDGSLSLTNKNKYPVVFLNITANTNFCENLQNYIKNKFGFGGYISWKNKTCKVKDLRYGGTLQVTYLLDWLYQDSTVFLNRKMNKYLEIKNFLTNYKNKGYLGNNQFTDKSKLVGYKNENELK